MDIRPVDGEASCAWALKEIEPYFASEPEPGTPDADRFDVLAALIGACEARALPIGPAEPIDVLRMVMEQTEDARRPTSPPCSVLARAPPRYCPDDATCPRT